jgi:PAS domain S-box-containing protein
VAAKPPTHATVDTTALRLAAVVTASDDAIISHDVKGIVETWNPAAERMFGYAPGEAIGRPIDEILPMPAPDPGSEGHFETVVRTRDGRLLDLSVAVSPIATPDGEIVAISRIARDITEQKALQREAFRLKAIVDSSEDAIVSKNLNGIVQTWNAAAERMFGYTAEEIVGQPITLIIPADRLAEEDEVLARIRSGRGIRHFETIRQRKDGKLIEISLTVSPVKAADGTIIGASKIARDISLQRRLAREAEDANRVKDEFLATLSHELRTPLNAVLGYTRMLREGHFSGREHRAIEIIERNGTVLSQLVSDVLDVSSIVTGKIRLNRGPCDLRAVVQAAVEMVRPSAEGKGVRLQFSHNDVPVDIVCDSDRMQQVFWNLLSNAVKFTPAGGRVDASIVVLPRHVAVTVADTGVGIAPASLPYVFQRFWQGETSKHRQPGGLGLGLSLSRHFTELHGGTIAAASEGPGRGAAFTVTLPRPV